MDKFRVSMKSWYLLYCKRGAQLRAKQNLENQGVECFYPQITIEKIRRGKKQQITEPLFPCYIFIYFNYEDGPSFTTIRSTKGVVDFIRFGVQPYTVDPLLIKELKRADEGNVNHVEQQLPVKGQMVKIKTGIFAGIDAIYQQADGDERSMVLIQLINQQVQSVIDNNELELYTQSN